MERLIRLVSSVRLALLLLLALALFSAVGTVFPQGLPAQEYERLYPAASGWIRALHLGRFYTSVPFRGLLALLLLNLTACAAGRCAEGWRNFRGRGVGGVRLPLDDRAAWVERLRSLRFRVRSVEPLEARKRTWAFLGFPLVHLAPVAVVAGGLWGNAGGTVGTRNVWVGDFTQTFDDASAGSPGQLPFTLRVESFRQLYYPMDLQVEVAPPGGKGAKLTIREGQTLAVPGTPYRLRVESFDPESRTLTYGVDTPTGQAGPFRSGQDGEAPLIARPTAYRNPDVRRAEALVSLSSPGGETLARQVVAVNEPLLHGGIRIYLTAWGNDPYRNPYVGLQFVRDPGQPLVWAGALSLSLGLVLLLFGDGAWVRERDGVLWAKGSRGQRSVARLQDRA